MPYSNGPGVESQAHSHGVGASRPLRCPHCGKYYGLTDKQARVLEFVRFKIYHDGQSPTYQEIATFCGYRSTSPVDNALKRLEEAGYVRRSGSRRRRVELVEAAPPDHQQPATAGADSPEASS